MPPATAISIDEFIARWSASGAAERANFQLFASELCDLLDVPPAGALRLQTMRRFP